MHFDIKNMEHHASLQTKMTVFFSGFRMARVLIRAIYCLYQLTACAHRLHVKHAAKPNTRHLEALQSLCMQHCPITRILTGSSRPRKGPPL